jgi:hypothetical protein
MGGNGVATGAGARVDVTLKLSRLLNFCKEIRRDTRKTTMPKCDDSRSRNGYFGLAAFDRTVRHGWVELIQFAAAVSSSSYKSKDSDHVLKCSLNLLLGSSGEFFGVRWAAAAAAAATAVFIVFHGCSSRYYAYRCTPDLHQVRESVCLGIFLYETKGTLEAFEVAGASSFVSWPSLTRVSVTLVQTHGE